MMQKKTSFSRLYTAGAAALLFVSLASSPQGANAADDPGAFIQNLGTQAIQVLGPSVPRSQRVAMFRQLLSRDFDLADAGRFVLGPAVRGLSPAQYEEFRGLFRDTLAQAYADKLSQYAGEPFRVTGERQMGDETVVTSEIIRHSGAPVRIDWHVVDRDGRPLVADVYVDGVSQKLTERGEFAGIIQRNGGRPDAIIAALRQQLTQGPTEETGSSAPPTSYPQPYYPAPYAPAAQPAYH